MSGVVFLFAFAGFAVWVIGRYLAHQEQPKHQCRRMVVRDGETLTCECGRVVP